MPPAKRDFGQEVYFKTFDEIILRHKKPNELELLDDDVIVHKGRIIVPNDQVYDVLTQEYDQNKVGWRKLYKKCKQDYIGIRELQVQDFLRDRV